MLEKYTQDLIVHSPKTFQAIHIYFTKSEEYSRWFFNHLFFVSAIILIFCIFNRLSRILKFYIKWLRLPTTDSVSKNAEPGGGIQIQVNPVGRQ